MSNRIVQLVRARLTEAQLRMLEEPPVPSQEDYESTFARIRLRLPALEEQVVRNEARVQDGYSDFADQPAGRQRTILRNAAPSLLVSLAQELIRQSYDARFEHLARSLKLARLAVGAAKQVVEAAYPSAESAADLLATAFAYLGNAERINSNHAAARAALSEADRWRRRGTGDRHLKATLLRFKAFLSGLEGRVEEEAALLDREIALRRLLRDSEGLGTALIDRGCSAIFSEPLSAASGYLRKGVSLVADPTLMLVALLPLAEALARQGKGLLAFKACCTADDITSIIGAPPQIARRHRWIKGLAYRALGELERAELELLGVRDEFRAERLGHVEGLVSLDLACVYATQGRVNELRELAERTYALLRSQGLELRARAALTRWHAAIQAEELSEELAIAVANLLTGFRRHGGPLPGQDR